MSTWSSERCIDDVAVGEVPSGRGLHRVRRRACQGLVVSSLRRCRCSHAKPSGGGPRRPGCSVHRCPHAPRGHSMRRGLRSGVGNFDGSSTIKVLVFGDSWGEEGPSNNAVRLRRPVRDWQRDAGRVAADAAGPHDRQVPEALHGGGREVGFAGPYICRPPAASARTSSTSSQRAR